MTPIASPSKRTLSTAEARREAVLEAGMTVFAERGFLGTPTIEVAKAAGISQAYLFRLFPTKSDLVLAVVRRSNERIEDAFVKAAAQAHARGETGEDVLLAMGEAYGELLEDRAMLNTQVHQHAAAASMPEVAEVARAWFARLYDLVSEATGLGPEDVHRFFATGMLLNVMAAIGATDAHGTWAQTLRVC
ncbi:MAG TPA: TetR/AcrR family transcriptional regulator [Baekduia sp.]|uniref:TetR/AcrR family transcriptional regulator n=1 Tax=Baekduia sp. TaxID=2600305 RepID=UPI002D08B179|nr:TetR/AcrR family transcriptional regulator [Baekduia sp.]HMJ34347.1 TetR/AcrR family transcriptional regulator [Baekduia sp.]